MPCALLLTGSPKGTKSTSDSLGSYLLDHLKKNKFETEKIHIHKALRSAAGTEQFLSSCSASDLLIFAFPLFIDSLPAPVIKSMELIAEHYNKNKPAANQKMVVIINCGFPEVSHNSVALEICRLFALQTSIEYAGGLALGAGGAIDGRSLDSAAAMVRNVRKSLDLAGVSLTRGENISDEAVSLMAKKMMPDWLYTFIGDLGWKRTAKKYGAANRLYDKPY